MPHSLSDAACATVCLSFLALIVFLMLRNKSGIFYSGAGLFVGFCCIMIFQGIDARSKGFANVGEMQDAARAGTTDAVVWRKHVALAEQSKAREEAQVAIDRARAIRASEALVTVHQAASPRIVNFVSSLPPGTRDVSNECRKFQEDARYAQEQADMMRTADLRHGWESNRDTSLMLYRSTCE